MSEQAQSDFVLVRRQSLIDVATEDHPIGIWSEVNAGVQAEHAGEKAGERANVDVRVRPILMNGCGGRQQREGESLMCR